ncbi:hypothetical protein DFH09DRAFT_1323085 [Mycena vulgaris]|nr:hypothetical protein DFH09DRAFT_1323085 [Mycena vulgaris]
MHLTQPDVAAVICLKFSTAAFRNPASSRPSVPPASPASLNDFKVVAGSPLGPIKYGDHTWSHAIRAIELDMYLKKVGETRACTTVRIDRQESHRAAMVDDVSPARSNPSDSVDGAPAGMKFIVIADVLIDLARRDDADDATESRQPPSIATRALPPTPASPSVTTPARTIPAYKKIKLADVF